ncbi:MAG: alpha/beta fold hydrolase [Verrucomicrobiota bacterium]
MFEFDLKESRFFSETSQRDVYCLQVFPLTGASNGKTVLLFHGLGDHTGRYVWAFRLLVSLGYEVLGFDWPGNGKSEGVRGDMPVPEEVGPLLSEVVRHLGVGRPVGLLAHSTGGFLSIPLIAMGHPLLADLSWVWFSSPLLRPGHGQWEIKKRVAVALAERFPRFTVSTGVKRSDCHHRPVEDRLDGTSEGVHSRVSLRFGAAALDLEDQIPGMVDRFPPSLACLQTVGDMDPVCPPFYSRQFHDRIPGSRKALIWVRNGLHEPFLEIPSARFFNSVRSWLLKSSCESETTSH